MKFIQFTFDPEKLLDRSNLEEEWVNENIYSPACVLKNDSDGVLSLRLINGEVVKMIGGESVLISDQDDEGVPDILRLRSFSEMSLIHTLRVRYSRDEIYSFVGPILISINPYKRIPELYDDVKIFDYHNHKQVRKL